MIGSKVNKQRNLQMRLVLGSPKWVDLHTHPPNLKVYIESVTGFSHVYSPDGIKPALLSQGYSLRQLLGAEKAGRAHILRTGQGWGASSCLGRRSIGGHVFLIISFYPPSLVIGSYNLICSLPSPAPCIVPWVVSKGFHQHRGGSFDSCLAVMEKYAAATARVCARKKPRSGQWLPKSATVFSTRSHIIQTTDLLNPLDWVLDHLGHSTVSSVNVLNRDDIVDSSGIHNILLG